jgi:hypothetical protein
LKDEVIGKMKLLEGRKPWEEVNNRCWVLWNLGERSKQEVSTMELLEVIHVKRKRAANKTGLLKPWIIGSFRSMVIED